MVHWSRKRITSSPSAPGTGPSDRPPASGRYDHRWNERWKALTRRVSWSNSILWKCIFLCIMRSWCFCKRTGGWVAGWLPSLYLDDLNDCLSVKFAACAGLISMRCVENPFFLSWYIWSGSQNAAPKQEEISRRSQAVLRMTTAYWRCLCRFVVNSPVGVWEAVNTLQLSDWVMQVKGDLSSTHQLKRRES